MKTTTSGSARSLRDRPQTVALLACSAQAKAPAKAPGAGELISRIREGLPVSELDALRDLFDLPMERLAPKLGLSKATLHRRKHEGRLASDESERVLRFARLFGKARDAFGSEAAARQWLSSPQVGLGGAVPLDFAETEVGAREVEDLLGRIEFGVYS